MALNVVCIVGVGRSGSTLLDRILGTVPGTVSLNELRPLWRNGFLDNAICACGTAFADCPFWSDVRQRLEFKFPLSAQEMLDLHNRVDRGRRLPQLMIDRRLGRFAEDVQKYRRLLKSLHEAIAECSGADTVIDSSKVPTRALLLGGIPEFNVQLVHIVRDVRGVAYSWTKAIIEPGTGEEIKRFTAWKSVALWYYRNLVIEALRYRLPYVRVSYEQLASEPRATVNGLLEQLPALSGRAATFESEHSVHLQPVHSMSGNPHRFRSGPTEIRVDDEWRRKMPLGTRRFIEITSLPLLAHYGYTVRI
jgi:hypothetical protein